MKKTLAIVLLLLLVPAFIQANHTTDQEEIMKIILDDLEGNYLKGDISGNQRIYEKFMGLDVLEGIGYNIKENLGMTETDRRTQEDDNYNQMNFYGYDKDENQLTIILSSYFDEEIDKGETYLYINFANQEQFLKINGIIDDIDNIYNDYNVNAEITTNIIGSIDGSIDFDRYQDRINESIEGINGNILGTYEDDNLISYNIYTNWIDNFMTIEKDKMNLNIALRYNESDDATLIFIGTPIITGGY